MNPVLKLIRFDSKDYYCPFCSVRMSMENLSNADPAVQGYIICCDCDKHCALFVVGKYELHFSLNNLIVSFKQDKSIIIEEYFNYRFPEIWEIPSSELEYPDVHAIIRKVQLYRALR